MGRRHSGGVQPPRDDAGGILKRSMHCQSTCFDVDLCVSFHWNHLFSISFRTHQRRRQIREIVVSATGWDDRRCCWCWSMKVPKTHTTHIGSTNLFVFFQNWCVSRLYSQRLWGLSVSKLKCVVGVCSKRPSGNRRHRWWKLGGLLFASLKVLAGHRE